MGQVDRISVIKNRPGEYPLAGSKNYLLDMDEYTKNEDIDSLDTWDNAQKKAMYLPEIDTIASATPASPTAASSEHKDIASSGTFSFSTIVDMGKKAWDWVCGLFSGKKEAEPVAAAPSDDGIQPISNSPSLKAPEYINKRELEKMLQELQEQAKRVEESSSEVKDQNLQDEKRFIAYYLAQYEIRKDGMLSIQYQFVFNQQKDREIRKEQSDLKAQNIEVEKDRKFWGTVSTVATVVGLAALVATVAISALATGGITLAGTVGAVFTMTPKVLGLGSGLIGGASTIVKGNLDWKQGEFKGKIELTNYQIKHLNELLRLQSSASGSEFNKALEITVLLKQMNDNLYKTMRVVSK